MAARFRPGALVRFANPFSDEELSAQLARVRSEMTTKSIDVARISTRENIFDLTGLAHWDYLAPHLLIVPTDDERPQRKLVIAHELARIDARCVRKSTCIIVTLA